MKFDDLQRQIIMDHYKHPQNKAEETPAGYVSKRGLNPSCGDDVTIFLLLEDGVVTDLKWNGDGCSICCASASIMTNEFVGQTIEQLDEKYENFKQMVSGHEYDVDAFEDAVCFNGIKDYPARFKCAIISWDTAYQLVKGDSDGQGH
ncbi:SUF system NifU family Fe-S cluster assembly protein [Mollicutes bacterium LVI A0039]|nr:SUF system NifU family Fe-S cluster assembly protein [Mollicutes bacterium LVI A0039]